MKTAIIGAGNMGGSIARGLAKGSIIPASDIIVSNPSQGKLDELKVEFPALQITHDNQEAIIGAEFIILAVKPWLIKSVLRELKLKSKQIIISVAAGINFEELAHYVPEPEMTMFRIIPNTAISEMESMTLIASRKPNADFACRGLLSQITYPTGGYTTFEYEPHQYKDMVTRDSSSDNLPYLKIGSSTFTTGGLRIKKITDHPLTGTPNTRSYLYLTADGKSSGNLLIHPYYYFHMDEYSRTTGVRNEQDIWLANYANSDASESHIEYERVMEVYTEATHTHKN